jgi:hypothetical protein
LPANQLILQSISLSQINTAVDSNPQPRKRKRTTLSTPHDEHGIPIAKKGRVRTNWQHPLLWPAIDSAARRAHFQSSQEIVSYLQHRYSNEGTYDTLARSTVNGWILKTGDRRTWTSDVLSRVKKGSCWIAGIF